MTPNAMIYRARVDWIAGGLTLAAMRREPYGAWTQITARDRDGHTWRSTHLANDRALAVWLRGASETGEPWEHDPRECIACDNHKPFTLPAAPVDPNESNLT